MGRLCPQFNNLKVLEDGETVDPKRQITIQQLFNHTSGLAYGLSRNSEVDRLYQDANLLRAKTSEEFLDTLSTLPLKYHPGDKYNYSVSVDVQGCLVEILSGMPLDEFLKNRIFDPLGMQDTFFEVPSDKKDRFAAGYVYNKKTDKVILGDSPETSRFAKEVTFFSGGGGLVSTAADYWRFCQMMLNEGEFNRHRLLSRKTVELMRSDHFPATLVNYDANADHGFGLGFRVVKEVSSTGAPGSVGEYYWGGAAGTIFWIDPAEELIVVTMIQVRNAPYNLRRKMHSLVYPALVDKL